MGDIGYIYRIYYMNSKNPAKNRQNMGTQKETGIQEFQMRALQQVYKKGLAHLAARRRI